MSGAVVSGAVPLRGPSLAFGLGFHLNTQVAGLPHAYAGEGRTQVDAYGDLAASQRQLTQAPIPRMLEFVGVSVLGAGSPRRSFWDMAYPKKLQKKTHAEDSASTKSEARPRGQ